MGISVVINTYNAASHLQEVLTSLQTFDEIVICDMESTDDTLEIAKTFDCKIVTFPKGNYTIAEPARDFAIKQASELWVLVVDADEVVTPLLREYLYQLIQQSNCPDGLYIPRKNYFLGHFMHCDYPDSILRFFRKDKAYWPPTVHSIPRIEGKIERIPAKRKDLAFIHLANDSIRVMIRKANDYTDNEIIRKKDRNFGVLALLYRPFVRFTKFYIFQGGIFDGKAGFIRACLSGYHQFIMVAKIIESKNGKKTIK